MITECGSQFAVWKVRLIWKWRYLRERTSLQLSCETAGYNFDQITGYHQSNKNQMQSKSNLILIRVTAFLTKADWLGRLSLYVRSKPQTCLQFKKNNVQNESFSWVVVTLHSEIVNLWLDSKIFAKVVKFS